MKKVNKFDSIYKNAANLKSVPNDLFSLVDPANETQFIDTFAGTDISILPDIDHLTNISKSEGTYSGIINIENIPNSYLVSNYTGSEVSLYRMFAQCYYAEVNNNIISGTANFNVSYSLHGATSETAAPYDPTIFSNVTYDTDTEKRSRVNEDVGFYTLHVYSALRPDLMIYTMKVPISIINATDSTVGDTDLKTWWEAHTVSNISTDTELNAITDKQVYAFTTTSTTGYGTNLNNRNDIMAYTAADGKNYIVGYTSGTISGDSSGRTSIWDLKISDLYHGDSKTAHLYAYAIPIHYVLNSTNMATKALRQNFGSQIHYDYGNNISDVCMFVDPSLSDLSYMFEDIGITHPPTIIVHRGGNLDLSYMFHNTDLVATKETYTPITVAQSWFGSAITVTSGIFVINGGLNHITGGHNVETVVEYGYADKKKATVQLSNNDIVEFDFVNKYYDNIATTVPDRPNIFLQHYCYYDSSNTLLYYSENSREGKSLLSNYKSGTDCDTVVNASHMFDGSLLTGWNIEPITAFALTLPQILIDDASFMYRNTKIYSIKTPSTYGKNLYMFNLESMFDGCSNLQSVPKAAFLAYLGGSIDTDKCYEVNKTVRFPTSIKRMFANCSNLKSAPFTDWAVKDNSINPMKSADALYLRDPRLKGLKYLNVLNVQNKVGAYESFDMDDVGVTTDTTGCFLMCKNLTDINYGMIHESYGGPHKATVTIVGHNMVENGYMNGDRIKDEVYYDLHRGSTANGINSWNPNGIRLTSPNVAVPSIMLDPLVFEQTDVDVYNNDKTTTFPTTIISNYAYDTSGLSGCTGFKSDVNGSVNPGSTLTVSGKSGKTSTHAMEFTGWNHTLLHGDTVHCSLTGCLDTYAGVPSVIISSENTGGESIKLLPTMKLQNHNIIKTTSGNITTISDSGTQVGQGTDGNGYVSYYGGTGIELIRIKPSITHMHPNNNIIVSPKFSVNCEAYSNFNITEFKRIVDSQKSAGLIPSTSTYYNTKIMIEIGMKLCLFNLFTETADVIEKENTRTTPLDTIVPLRFLISINSSNTPTITGINWETRYGFNRQIEESWYYLMQWSNYYLHLNNSAAALDGYSSLQRSKNFWKAATSANYNNIYHGGINFFLTWSWCQSAPVCINSSFTDYPNLYNIEMPRSYNYVRLSGGLCSYVDDAFIFELHTTRTYNNNWKTIVGNRMANAWARNPDLTGASSRFQNSTLKQRSHPNLPFTMLQDYSPYNEETGANNFLYPGKDLSLIDIFKFPLATVKSAGRIDERICSYFRYNNFNCDANGSGNAYNNYYYSASDTTNFGTTMPYTFFNLMPNSTSFHHTQWRMLPLYNTGSTITNYKNNNVVSYASSYANFPVGWVSYTNMSLILVQNDNDAGATYYQLSQGSTSGIPVNSNTTKLSVYCSWYLRYDLTVTWNNIVRHSTLRDYLNLSYIQGNLDQRILRMAPLGVYSLGVNTSLYYKHAYYNRLGWLSHNKHRITGGASEITMDGNSSRKCLATDYPQTELYYKRSYIYANCINMKRIGAFVPVIHDLQEVYKTYAPSLSWGTRLNNTFVATYAPLGQTGIESTLYLDIPWQTTFNQDGTTASIYSHWTDNASLVRTDNTFYNCYSIKQVDLDAIVDYHVLDYSYLRPSTITHPNNTAEYSWSFRQRRFHDHYYTFNQCSGITKVTGTWLPQSLLEMRNCVGTNWSGMFTGVGNFIGVFKDCYNMETFEDSSYTVHDGQCCGNSTRFGFMDNVQYVDKDGTTLTFENQMYALLNNFYQTMYYYDFSNYLDGCTKLTTKPVRLEFANNYYPSIYNKMRYHHGLCWAKDIYRGCISMPEYTEMAEFYTSHPRYLMLLTGGSHNLDYLISDANLGNNSVYSRNYTGEILRFRGHNYDNTQYWSGGNLGRSNLVPTNYGSGPYVTFSMPLPLDHVTIDYSTTTLTAKFDPAPDKYMSWTITPANTTPTSVGWEMFTGKINSGSLVRRTNETMTQIDRLPATNATYNSSSKTFTQSGNTRVYPNGTTTVLNTDLPLNTVYMNNINLNNVSTFTVNTSWFQKRKQFGYVSPENTLHAIKQNGVTNGTMPMGAVGGINDTDFRIELTKTYQSGHPTTYNNTEGDYGPMDLRMYAVNNAYRIRDQRIHIAVPVQNVSTRDPYYNKILGFWKNESSLANTIPEMYNIRTGCFFRPLGFGAWLDKNLFSINAPAGGLYDTCVDTGNQLRKWVAELGCGNIPNHRLVISFTTYSSTGQNVVSDGTNTMKISDFTPILGTAEESSIWLDWMPYFVQEPKASPGSSWEVPIRFSVPNLTMNHRVTTAYNTEVLKTINNRTNFKNIVNYLKSYSGNVFMSFALDTSDYAGVVEFYRTTAV